MSTPATNVTPSTITIVSGLPRSGTSVMMQMLDAGGLPALTDGQRTADDDNPRGYFEFEPVKQTRRDSSWLGRAHEKVVKMVHMLLPDLPVGASHRYRVVMMRRDLDEVLTSQGKMLKRSGKAGASLDPKQLQAVYRQQLEKVNAFLSAHPNDFSTIEISYNDLMADPKRVATKLNQFLGGKMDEAKMASAVDPNLYRNRKS